MRKTFIIIILILTSTILKGLGGYGTFNNRNHSEIKWLEISSENITIIYHNPLEKWAKESLTIAEASYKSLAKTYNHTPEGKIKIFISNQDDIANGATVLDEYIFIYVNQSEYLSIFSGNDLFLRKVIAHEMSHYFLCSATTDWLAKIFPLKNNFFPRDLNEGFAQFFSGEEWGKNRGDRFLRNSVYSNKNLITTQTGTMIYARGFSLVRYLAYFYGEDKLTKLFSYRNNLNIFSLKKAFKEIYKKDYSDIQKEWDLYIKTLYFGQAYNHKLISDTNNKSFSETFTDFKKICVKLPNLNQITIKDSFALIVSKSSKKQGYNDLFLAKINIDSLNLEDKLLFSNKKLISLGSFTNINLSNNGQKIVFQRYSRHKNGSLFPTIYYYDVKTKKLKRLFVGSFPQITNSGIIFYKTKNEYQNFITKFENNLSKNIYITDKNCHIENISLSPDENKLAFALLEENSYKIIVMNIIDKNIITKLDFPTFPEKIFWINEKQILTVFANPQNFTSEYKIFNIKSQEQKEYNSPIFDINPTYINLKNDSLKIYGFSDIIYNDNSFGHITFKEKKDTLTKKNHYNSWQFLENKNKINYNPNKKTKIVESNKYNSIKNIKYRFGLALPTKKSMMLGTIFSEPLNIHFISLFGWIPYDLDNSFYYYFNYSNKYFYPTITFESYKIDWIANIAGDLNKKSNFYWEELTINSINANFNLDFIKAYFWKQTVDLKLSYKNFKAKDKKLLSLNDDNGENLYQNGEGLIGSFAYNIIYNLPYLNDNIHPVRKFSLTYNLSGAKKNIVNKNDYIEHKITLFLAYSPLYFFSNNYFFKSFSIRNESYIQIKNGKFVNQFSPGFDKYEIILSGDTPLLNRHYIRGYDITTIGNMTSIVKTSIWLKITDNLNLSFAYNILSLKYLGAGFWLDNNFVENNNNMTQKNALGYEIRSKINLLGLPFQLRFGEAHKFNKKYLGKYYVISLSFVKF